MEELTKLLDPKLFIQVSRSEIFPFDFIQGYNKKVPCVILKGTLDAEVEGKISEGRLNGFIEAFDAYTVPPIPGQLPRRLTNAQRF